MISARHYNVKGFADFLGKYDDADTLALDESSAQELQKRFELFEGQKKTTQEVHALYKDKIQRELGVRLTPEDLAGISQHIEKLAMEDPEQVKALLKQVEDFKEGEKKLRDQQKTLSGLIGKKDIWEVGSEKGKITDKAGRV